jgi:hypothetical protein
MDEMKLAQILIEAGVNPDDLHPDCKFIAQDGDDGLVSQFKDEPFIVLGAFYEAEYEIFGSDLLNKYYDLIAEDWQTTLSRANFIAAYEAHHA